MQAGRELDALVAEKVMGWNFLPVEATVVTTRTPDGTTTSQEFPWNQCPWCGRHNGADMTAPFDMPVCDGKKCRFSTDIAAAWQVVERMRELGWTFGLQDRMDSPGVIATFIDEERSGIVARDRDTHAICLAALQALGVLTP